MTCVVGLIDKTRTYIGADSAGVSGGSLAMSIRADSKVFRNGSFLFGFTSSFRMGQLIRHALTPPPVNGMDLERYMATTFVDAVRNVLKDGGFSKISESQEEGGTFMVATQNRLFTVYDDYQVEELVQPYGAVGGGAPIALGSLHTSTKSSAVQRVRLALEAASTHNAGVHGPHKVLYINHSSRSE